MGLEVVVVRANLLGLLALGLALGGCTLVSHTPVELPLSTRHRLVVLDAVELQRAQEGEVEVVEFRFLDSPYAPKDLYELGESLKAQLKARGFAERCQTFNPLPLFGGPQYTLRAARGNEGVGVYLRALAQPSSYRAEVSSADPNPPLSCPPR